MSKTKDVKKKKSQWAEVWKRLKKNKMAVFGLIILVGLILVAIFANQIADYQELAIKQNPEIRLQGPSKDHWFGTDNHGRDIFARIVHGSRVSLSVGIIAVVGAILVGGFLGAIAGYYGGRLDNVIMRIMDVFLAILSILLAIAIVSSLGSSLVNLMISVGISSIPSYARVVRASVLQLRTKSL